MAESAASKNLLVDGDARIYDGFMAVEQGDMLFQSLLATVPWQQPVIRMFGRQIPSPRLAAWYGDHNAVYQYSGIYNIPLPWLPDIQALRSEIETRLEQVFNSVLLNLYRNGNDAMGWHADDEPELGTRPAIASLSLRATRRFRLRHRHRKDIAPVALDLSHGSLLLLTNDTQKNWHHSISRTRCAVGPRINLTFRRVIGDASGSVSG